MGFYKHIKELWKRPKENLGSLYKERLIKWRKQPSIVKIDRPTRLDRARSLGYKAKKGYIIVRIKVIAGGRKRTQSKAGRRSSHARRKMIVKKNYQLVAEERVQKKYTNLEVLNSYKVMSDSKHHWFEVILIDPERPEIKKDPKTKWISSPGNKNRVYRGKTSAGKKSRGLRGKGKGREKVRPSLKSHKRRGN